MRYGSKAPFAMFARPYADSFEMEGSSESQVTTGVAPCANVPWIKGSACVSAPHPPPQCTYVSMKLGWRPTRFTTVARPVVVCGNPSSTNPQPARRVLLVLSEEGAGDWVGD